MHVTVSVEFSVTRFVNGNLENLGSVTSVSYAG